MNSTPSQLSDKGPLAKHIPGPAVVLHVPDAGEVLTEIRREFELQQGRQELYDIKFALSDGRTRLRMLQESIGFSR
jgi:hypothetical protein